MDEARTGRIAALITAGTYTLASIIVFIGTIVEDDNEDNDGAIGTAMWISWWVLVVVGTFAAAVVIYALLKRSGVFDLALAKVAVVVGVLAALASFVSWAFFIWGILLSIAFLLAALALRQRVKGVVGAPSSWDWVIPIAWPLGVVVTLLLVNLDVVDENQDGLDWGYTSGFLIGALLTAVTMVQIATWLNTPAPVVQPLEPTDGPGVAGI